MKHISSEFSCMESSESMFFLDNILAPVLLPDCLTLVVYLDKADIYFDTDLELFLDVNFEFPEICFSLTTSSICSIFSSFAIKLLIVCSKLSYKSIFSVNWCSSVVLSFNIFSFNLLKISCSYYWSLCKLFDPHILCKVSPIWDYVLTGRYRSRKRKVDWILILLSSISSLRLFKKLSYRP